MGYDRTFKGKFKLNKCLTVADYTYLFKFSETRHMARNVGVEYGVQGEWYINEKFDHDEDNPNVLDCNHPPKTQPSLWCGWVPTKDRKYIHWNGMEKFHDFDKWLKYLLQNWLIPRGYTLSGTVAIQGEDPSDKGSLEAADDGTVTMSTSEEVSLDEGDDSDDPPPKKIEPEMIVLKPRKIRLDP